MFNYKFYCKLANPHNPKEPPKDGEVPFFQDCSFQGKDYVATCCGSREPVWCLFSYKMEGELRDLLWKIQPGDVVVDVGAAYGAYTLTAILAGASKVYAIEPSKDDFFDLCSNLFINTLNEKCVALNILLGEETTIKHYFESTHSLVRIEGQSSFRIQTTLDKLVFDYKINKLDWLKIDVEGSEISVLRGSLETLKKFKPKVLLEVHPLFIPDIDERVKEIFMSLGYEGRLLEGKENNEKWYFWEFPSN